MLRTLIRAFAITLCLSGTALAHNELKSTASDRMMPAGEKARWQACQDKAVRQNIKMDERARFVMDCMKEMAK
jgi:hypothetical protein